MNYEEHIACCRGWGVVPLFWNVRNKLPKSGHKCITEVISRAGRQQGWNFKMNIKCQDFVRNKYFRKKVDAICYKFGIYLLYISTQRKKYNIPYNNGIN